MIGQIEDNISMFSFRLDVSVSFCINLIVISILNVKVYSVRYSPAHYLTYNEETFKDGSEDLFGSRQTKSYNDRYLIEKKENQYIAKCSGIRLMCEMMNGDTFTMIDSVRKQYEDLPYPEFNSRNISDEEEYYKKDMDTPKRIVPSHTLEKLNHFLHRGNESFRYLFRMIVAGGGTGVVTVFMGEQINHTNGEIVYLDLSIASMRIAQKRAQIRCLRNIIWIHNWIEGLRFLGLGLFEELQCSGVLHHLKRPVYGLNILKDTLNLSGGLTLMVYGEYGRSAVYQSQHLLKIINTNQVGIEKELSDAMHILQILPERNWFMRRPIPIADHNSGKIGIYDLLLHKRDVAFTIKTLIEWIESSGLHFVDFDHYKKRYFLQIQYIISDVTLARIAYTLDHLKRLCIAELLDGHMITHSFYSSKIPNSVADIHDASNIIYLYGNPHGLRGAVSNQENRAIRGNETFFISRMYSTYINQLKSNSYSNVYEKHVQNNNNPFVTFGWKLNGFNEFLVKQLLDSNKGSKIKNVCVEYKETLEKNIDCKASLSFSSEFYKSVKDTGMFLLKNEYIAPFPKTSFLNLIRVKDI